MLKFGIGIVVLISRKLRRDKVFWLGYLFFYFGMLNGWIDIKNFYYFSLMRGLNDYRREFK